MRDGAEGRVLGVTTPCLGAIGPKVRPSLTPAKSMTRDIKEPCGKGTEDSICTQ